MSEEVKCAGCGKKYLRTTAKHKGKKGQCRSRNSVTCSHKCSVEDQRRRKKEYHARPEIKARIREYNKKYYKKKK